MAAFRNKDNGSWYVQFRYTDWRGERKQKLKRGFATKKEALAWEREFLMQTQADVGMTLAKRDTVAAKGTLKRRSLFKNPGKGALLYMVMYVRAVSADTLAVFASLCSGQGLYPCAAWRLTQYCGKACLSDASTLFTYFQGCKYY